jgi:protein gp37
MGETTIQWTDKTWNPTTGCSKVSPGCKNCYAERIFPRAYGKFRAFTDVRCHEGRLEQPLHWRKPRKVFVNSMSDLFHEAVPFEFVKQVWDVMARAQRHSFQILTKRPERMLEFTRWMAGADDISAAHWPENCWLGVSVEDQQRADERIPLLQQVPAEVRFISYEPALGPIDIEEHLMGMTSCHHPNWVIVGGESGQKARAFHPRWARSMVAQCRAAGVAVFVKQMGSLVIDRNDAGFDGDAPEAWPMDTRYNELDKGYQGAPVRIKLKDGHGGNPEEWPADLRVRQFPEVRG